MMQPLSCDHLLMSVPQLDKQHRELIAEVNEFSAAVDAGASRAEVELRVTRLIEDFQVHFDSEEHLMQSSMFPELTPHVDEHRKLIAQMTGLLDGLDSGGVQLCDALVLFVRLWAEQHIAGLDRTFAQFLGDGNARAGSGSSTTGQ
jgi:hemerythrin-like metal-binding protein